MLRHLADSRARRRSPHVAVALFSASVAAVLLTLLPAPTVFVNHLADAPLIRRTSRLSSVLPRRVSPGGHTTSAGRVVAIMPNKRAKGFAPANRPRTKDQEVCVPGSGKQKHKFFRFVNQGHNVSEVFFRVEGKMPWKRMGEICSTTGDYEEAIAAQWPILIDSSYYLSKKVRFWMAKEDEVVQFGYANQLAEIVPVNSGPLREGVPAVELKGMLNRCGYMPCEKPMHWRPMATVQKLTKPQGGKMERWFDEKKDHLLKRNYNFRLEAYQRYNPHKYRGPYSKYQNFADKHGIVVGAKRPIPR